MHIQIGVSLLMLLGTAPVWCAAVSTPAVQEQVIDAIKVIIYSEDGSTIVITQSDSQKPSLDGAPRSLDDIIFEQLVYEQAKRFKILPSESDIDKHLKAVQRENNLTLEQLKKIFLTAGYTYEQGRQQFAMLSAVNSVLDFKIRSRLIVPEKDVKTYYDANPQTVPTRYLLERAVVELPAGKDHETFERELKRALRHGKSDLDIVWSKPFWIADPDLAEDKQFITIMKPGTIAEPTALQEGFELFRLKAIEAEHVVPLQERYQEIANVLRKPRYEQLMAEFRKSLFDTASIIYF